MHCTHSFWNVKSWTCQRSFTTAPHLLWLKNLRPKESELLQVTHWVVSKETPRPFTLHFAVRRKVLFSNTIVWKFQSGNHLRDIAPDRSKHRIFSATLCTNFNLHKWHCVIDIILFLTSFHSTALSRLMYASVFTYLLPTISECPLCTSATFDLTFPSEGHLDSLQFPLPQIMLEQTSSFMFSYRPRWDFFFWNI